MLARTRSTPLRSPLRGFSSSSWKSYYHWNKPTEADQQVQPVLEVFEAGMRHHHIANTAYPIAHNTTLRPYRVPRFRDQDALKEVIQGAYGPLKEMGLYVHVPFCHTRCQFCEYTVVDPKVGRQEDYQQVYFDALFKEFDLYKQLLGTHQKTLVGFDIGGGTPSMATIPHISKLMEKVHECYKLPDTVHSSIETTPKIAATEPEKIKAYRRLGLQRISMGLQTTDFKQAMELGRHDNNGTDVQRAVHNIRTAGFDSFNIDLMYGFPERPGREHVWTDTVKHTIALMPEHITLYRMRYKGTKMAHLQDRVKLEQVNQQELEARQLLEAAGYRGAIGKNTFSRVPGNSGCSDYLDRRVEAGIPYLGLGLGAQSFSRHTLALNLGAVTKMLGQYVKSCKLERLPIQDLYHLAPSGAMGKFCAVSFYYGGINKKEFKVSFGVELEEQFPREVSFLRSRGLMVDLDNGRFQMTLNGKKHFGGVVSLFYANAVKAHLLKLRGGDPYRLPPLDSFTTQEGFRLGLLAENEDRGTQTGGVGVKLQVQPAIQEQASN